MPTAKQLDKLIINNVESQEVYDYMEQNGLINEDELYLVEGIVDDDTEIIEPKNSLEFISREDISKNDIIYLKENKNLDINNATVADIIATDYSSIKAVSPDENLIIFGADRPYNADLELYKIKDGKLEKIKNHHISNLDMVRNRRLKFTKDGKMLAVVSASDPAEDNRFQVELYCVSGDVLTKTDAISFSTWRDAGADITSIPFDFSNDGTKFVVGKYIYTIREGNFLSNPIDLSSGYSNWTDIKFICFNGQNLVFATQNSLYEISDYRYPLASSLLLSISGELYDLGVMHGYIWYAYKEILEDGTEYYRFKIVNNKHTAPNSEYSNIKPFSVKISNDEWRIVFYGEWGLDTYWVYYIIDNYISLQNQFHEDTRCNDVNFSSNNKYFVASLSYSNDSNSQLVKVYRNTRAVKLIKEFSINDINSSIEKIANNSLAVINRTHWTSGAQLNASTSNIKVEVDNSYEITIEAKCANEGEDFRFYTVDANQQTYELTSEGTLFGTVNEWNKHTFTFNSTISGNIGFRIHGGYKALGTTGFHTSKSDFYISSIIVKKDGEVIKEINFNEGISGWQSFNTDTNTCQVVWQPSPPTYRYLKVTDRQSSIGSGAILRTDLTLTDTTQTYWVEFDAKCLDENADFRLYLQNNGIDIAGCQLNKSSVGDRFDSGTRIGDSGWYRHRHSFKLSNSITFGLKIHGGYNAGSESTADFFLDNIKLTDSNGNILYSQTFNDDIAGWSSTGTFYPETDYPATVVHCKGVLDTSALLGVSFTKDAKNIIALADNKNIINIKLDYPLEASLNPGSVTSSDQYLVGKALNDTLEGDIGKVFDCIEFRNKKENTRSSFTQRVTLYKDNWIHDKLFDGSDMNDSEQTGSKELKMVGYTNDAYRQYGATFMPTGPNGTPGFLPISFEWSKPGSDSTNGRLLFDFTEDIKDFTLVFRGHAGADNYTHPYEIRNIKVYNVNDPSETNLLKTSLGEADVLICGSSKLDDQGGVSSDCFVLDNGFEKYLHITTVNSRSRQAQYFTETYLPAGKYWIELEWRLSPELITQSVVVPGVRKGDVVIVNTDHRIYSTDTTNPVYSIATDDNKVVFVSPTIPTEDIVADIISIPCGKE